ncbi:hypothetical protein FRX31_011985, partial [Thalictrum thalictroides]
MLSQCHGDLIHYVEFLSLFSGDQHHAGSGNNTSGNVSAVVSQLSSVVCLMHQPCDSLLK